MDSIKIKTPIGEYFCQASKKGIEKLIPYCELKHEDMIKACTHYSLNHVFNKLKQQLNEYFLGDREAFDLDLHAQGTAFQQSVWNSLIKIPYGKTLCYQEVANRIKGSKSDSCPTRAVGSANGKNPIHIIIPCHRVIRKDGGLGGYAGGLERKVKLLELERA